MSDARARKALRGAPTDCIPLLDQPGHPGFLKKLTGIDPFENTEQAIAKAVALLDIDLLAGSVAHQTQATADAPHLYGLHTTAWRHAGSPRADIVSYDPARDRPGDPAGMDEQTCRAFLQARLDRDRRLVGQTVLPIGFTYTTCIQYAAEDLHWPDFLMATVTGDKHIPALLDRCEAASAKIYRAYAATDVEVLFTHDDIAMTTGLIYSPAWLREQLLPRYRRLFALLKARQIPILFSTDGRFVDVAQDLVAAGADGFFLDTPCVTLEEIVQLCGKSLVYFTGPAPATMRCGTPARIREEIRRMAEIARDLPRFFFHLVGGWTHDTPIANVQAFYEACRKWGAR